MSEETLKIFAELMMKDKRDLVCTLMEQTAENIDLEKQLEEKDKVIDEAINFIEEHSRKEPPYYEFLEFYNVANLSELLEILERGKNGKS